MSGELKDKFKHLSSEMLSNIAGVCRELIGERGDDNPRAMFKVGQRVCWFSPRRKVTSSGKILSLGPKNAVVESDEGEKYTVSASLLRSENSPGSDKPQTPGVW